MKAERCTSVSVVQMLELGQHILAAHFRLYSWPAHCRDLVFRGATRILLRSLSTEPINSTEKEASLHDRSAKSKE